MREAWIQSLQIADGYYSVCGLKTGDYYVRTYGSYDQCYFSGWYLDASPWEDDPSPVHVDAPGEAANINFTFEKEGSISGRIVDPGGNPLEGVRIQVYNSDDEYDVGSSASDAEGYYTVKCLPTGDYYVRTRNYECYHEEWYNDAKIEGGDFPPVHVDAPYETQGIDFTLEPGGTISGRVLDQNGNPLEQVPVEIYA